MVYGLVGVGYVGCDGLGGGLFDHEQAEQPHEATRIRERVIRNNLWAGRLFLVIERKTILTVG